MLISHSIWSHTLRKKMREKLTKKRKGKQKRMVLFIRIEVHYCILPNRCQGLSCQYTTRKKFIMVFLILKCNIRYMNFLGSQ